MAKTNWQTKLPQDPETVDNTVTAAAMNALGVELNAATAGVAANVTALGTKQNTFNANGVLNGDIITTPAGFTTIPRWMMRVGSVGPSSGSLRLSHFYAPLAGSRSNISFMCNTTPSGGTPTLIRAAVYRIETDGSYTKLATTTNDTALLNASNTLFTKALSAPVTFVAGQLYAWGILIVQSAGTLPSLSGTAPLESGEGSLPPRVNGQVSGLSDLPAGNIALASVTGSGVGLAYARFS